MLDLERERLQRLNEYITVAYVTSFLIMGIGLIRFVEPFQMIGSTFTKAFYISSINTVLLCVAIYYLSRSLSSRIWTGNRQGVIDCILIGGVLATITVAVFLLAPDNGIKVLLFVPLILVSVSYGQKLGLMTAAAASFALVTSDLLKLDLPYPNKYLETDLIVVGVMFLITWLLGGLANLEKQIRDDLSYLATHDDLTGLVNHRNFQESLSLAVENALHSNSSVSLALIDIDFFKHYNDTFGHQKGDEALRIIGRILIDIAGERFTAARYGGEEFALIIPGGSMEALTVAEEIRSAIENRPFYGGSQLPNGRLTVSVGVANLPEQAGKKEELFRLADQALYRAKSLTRNKVSLYFSVLDDIDETLGESEQGLISSIRTLISIVNAKDRYTFGHSERVAVIAYRLASRAGLSEAEIKDIRYSAFLHDIGKIEIARDILQKEQPLTEEEWQILKQHPIWGAEIVKAIPRFSSVWPVVLCHHENIDGSGYPRGIKGDDIPIGARILRIVDSFDAITTDRPYKKGRTPIEAVREIELFAGRYYDPNLTNIFIAMVQGENYDLEALLRTQPLA